MDNLNKKQKALAKTEIERKRTEIKYHKEKITLCEMQIRGLEHELSSL